MQLKKHSSHADMISFSQTEIFYKVGKYIIFKQILRIPKPKRVLASIQQKVSMMWPSQNFLLYNGIIIKIKVHKRINN